MRKVHASLLACTAAVLAGCAGGPKSEAPAGVTLAGNWKLNHALSDDPQKVIARMRAQALKIMARVSGGPEEAARGGPAGRGGARGTQSQSPDANPALTPDEPAPGGRGARRPDPLQYSPMMHVLSQMLARGDFLTVRQSSEELVFDYGITARSFTPGVHSVVSAQMGVADQVSGWEGSQYVINIRAQLGPNIVDRYGLSKDGQRLIENLRIGPAELPAVALIRVYERTTETAPRAPPTSD
ncbi:MAG TPA: hypothetical protein VEY89_11420 [Candidatus Dormibacteraeota bacterium]|nr:hypothetical protein [Candidatus Dormibacteraeota bacterium]